MSIHDEYACKIEQTLCELNGGTPVYFQSLRRMVLIDLENLNTLLEDIRDRSRRKKESK